ncbi:helix-turn-helix domain-containing protein [Agrobacterium tumefaciens]|nr:helix-turn-helix domain-containing protein [Agrobacterium tumefaciens]
MKTQSNIVDRIVSELGGLTKTAAALGLENPSVVANWRTRGQVPYQRVVDIERLTGISRHELRPDVFGPGSTA